MSKKRQQQLKQQRKKVREREKQQRKKMKRLTIVTVTFFAVLFAAVAVYLSAGGSEKTKGPGSPKGGVDFAYEEEPLLGQKDAPLKVVEFGDYQCPACRAFHEIFFPNIKEKYIETGKVAFYFMDFAFLGEDSVEAALAAEAVYRQNPEAFWAYHNALYEHQKKENSGYITIDFLVNLAKKYTPEIDTAKLEEAIREEKYINEIQEDRQKALDSGVSGTPTFFINGKMVERPYPELELAIQDALNRKGE